ncbi:MAG TPA: MtrB/PioB family outer membrane beta-barrel protein [Candidatus Acidoferrum sp.]|nr:MtrB/PioB family outer membrane beta-barrel protein [Candidatus Acidoferrum sp.]
MKHAKQLSSLMVLALLSLPACSFAQDKEQDKQRGKETDHGSVEFGVRYSTGDVYGRPDLRTGQCLGCGTPFDPSLKTSKFAEYRDMRDGFYVRRFDLHYDNILGSKEYVSLQSQRTLYRDQGYLGSFGQFGKFRIQFRYDETPHTYTNTARTLFTQTSSGVWSFPAAIRSQLQASTPTNLPSLLAGTGANVGQGTVTNFNFITPSIIRKAGTATFSFNPTAAWNLSGFFWREHQTGLRPIGLIMNSSPSASATSGFGVELPEPINYFNNLLRIGAEYGKQSWAVQAAYVGSFFQNHTGELVWDNPFLLTGETITTPLIGRMDLYPDNEAHYLSFAGATDVTKYLRFMASITPGWLRQNDSFIPYSTNTAINTCGNGTQACTSLAALPAASLHGDKQTLAMNYTLVTTAWKNVQLKAGYRQYDYNNNTPVHTFTPVEGDVNNPGSAENTPFGFNRKNVEVSGEWFFAKKSSFKAGYEGEIMDRSHRDAAHSLENSFFTSVDWVPIRDLLFRVSYRYSDRNPDRYQDDASSDPVTGAEIACTDTTTVSFTADQRCHRRFDEASRLRHRGDGLIEYSPTDKVTLSAFGGSLQDNYNRPGGTNSPMALNFLTGSAATVGPYYLYGLLKDISYSYGFDADYALAPQVTIFAEFSHENYHKRMITRNRTPVSAPTTILTCGGCDTPNNDWESVANEPVYIYTAGADMYFGKKVYFTTYYSLSAGRGNVFSRPLGDPTITSGANQFTLLGTNAAVPYPETVNRNHEVVVVFKYKLTEKLMPKLEYHYQQWDYKDYQTSPMTQYMGCISPIPNGPPATNSVPGCTTPILTSNTPNPVGVPSPFYPYFVVGDTSAARYLFLGVDQPSYHAHTLIATLEYRF